jgi:hypothetical protein
VTRFFIPLIDVLTLLFASFLMLPVLKATAETERANAPERPSVSDTPEELQRRLVVRILAMERATHKNAQHEYELVYRNPDRPQPVAVLDEEGAHAVIAQDTKDFPVEQLYYLVLLPRDDSKAAKLYPRDSDLKNYRKWFKGVALGFEDRQTGTAHNQEKRKP